MKVLVLQGSPRPSGNTAQMAAAYPAKPPMLKKAAMILSSGDANMYDGALFSLRGDFLDYLGLENAGVFTSHGGENGSKAKLEELRRFGASLKD